MFASQTEVGRNQCLKQLHDASLLHCLVLTVIVALMVNGLWCCKENVASADFMNVVYKTARPKRSMLEKFRARRDYWETIMPASGRPKCPSMSTPEGWGVTKGHADLLQHREATSSQEMKHVLEMQKKAKARRDYWETLKPASGRPLCPSLSVPDGWGVTKGHTDLLQQKEATSQEQLKQLFDRSKTH
ncbi:Betaine--homocysteine S-methyltransferase 1 [Collichthys lucidus]|uniref:Betaine--homocysteine S-methyltransferase 1 n=1 Tax=Collichthys lucidus TaxID=240159 RepID=A0A4U5UT27_COLLU|nr:Betaine--homocysteine S-methyltransferase 1 [Collichthys lucidus]